MIAKILNWLFGPSLSADQKREMVVRSLAGRDAVSGRELRRRLREDGLKLTAAGFYAVMADLEAGGHVVGWYRNGMINGVPVKTRCYRLPEVVGPEGGWD